MTTQADIEDMIARVALHDRAAFEALYSATSAKLFGITLRILNDRAAAQEVLQQVYVNLWNGGAETVATGRTSPISRLAALTRNCAMDRLRHARPTPDLDAASDVVDPAPGPEDFADMTSERARLDACLAELEPDRAAAVRRAYLDGDTYAELAAGFDIPINMVRTWLRRSLIGLKDCLTR